MTNLTIGAGLVINDWTPQNLVFPLGGKTLFTIKADGSIERGEGFTTEDEMSLHFWAMIEKLGMTLKPRKIEYSYDDKDGRIVLPAGAPFDGKPVLIQIANGWCEAWWLEASVSRTPDGDEHEGFHWVCMDDDFQVDLDEAKYWLPLPTMAQLEPK